MRRSSLVVAVILLFASAMVAQHSSGGGGGGGGGSHSSGGGGGSSSGSSHSSSSGGGSSAGSHSSSGSSSHTSSAHGPSSHGSGSTTASPHSNSPHSNLRESHSNAVRALPEPRGSVQTNTAKPEKHGLFSFLRHHPPRKFEPKAPEPKPVTDLRRRICVHGPCQVCPAGQASNGHGGCSGAYIANNRYFCSQFGFWRSGCSQNTNFTTSDCVGLRLALEKQEQRMRQAETARQNACSSGTAQECSELTNTSRSEDSLYRQLEERYRQCRQRSLGSYSFGSFGYGSYPGGQFFDPLDFGVDYP